MKNSKTNIIGLLILFVILSCFVCIKKGVFNSILKPENNIHEKTIQARLVDAGNLTLPEGYKSYTYAGTLTFQNLSDGVLHTYYVCIKDKSIVQLNAIYDLRVDYYVPHSDPNGSIMRNGCNGLNPPIKT